MHRSGTSAVAEMLSASGIDFGQNLIPAGEDNPKGFWEDKELVALHDKLLGRLGFRWDSSRELPDSAIQALAGTDTYAQLRAFLESRLAGSGCLGLKDPRICRLLPLWQRLIDELSIDVRYVLTVRNPQSVAQSLSVRNGFGGEKSCLLWLDHVSSVIAFLQDKPFVLVDYDGLLADPEGLIRPVVAALPVADAEGAVAAAAAVIEPALRHNKASETHVASGSLIEELADDFYRQLQGMCGEHASFGEAMADLDDQLLRYRQLVPIGAYIDRAAEAESKALESENAWLQRCLDSSNAELKKLAEAYDKRGAEVERLETEVLARGTEIGRLTGEVRAGAERSVQLEQDKLRLEQDNSRLDAELSGLGDKIGQLESEVADLHQGTELRDSEIIRLKDCLSESEAARQRLKSSLSWRLTWPIRAVPRFFSRIGAWLLWLVTGGFLPARTRKAIGRAWNDLVCRVHLPVNGRSNKNSIEMLAAHRQTALQERAPVRTENADDLPEIDISVVTYNSERWIKPFLESLCVQAYPLHLINLVFVDNASSDHTRGEIASHMEVLQDRFASFSLEERPNLGFGAGHDYGIGKGQAEFVMVANVDLEFEPDAIVNVVNFARRDAENVASWELRQKPYEHPKYYDPVTLETSWSSHACILMRRSAYRAVGGYEKRIFMYGEDVELSYRFRDRGFTIRYFPASVVWHHTYEHENQIKPLQYFGSTLANAYIRLRYGSFSDILSIVGMYAYLIYRGGSLPGARKGLFRNLLKIAYNAPYFLLTRKKSDTAFPFRAWDYEMQRDGAFYENRRVASGRLPLVSIVTRTYQGRGKWLVEAIASVFNQTYPNIELLIVEDGGDSTAELVAQLAELAPAGVRVRYSAQPKHGRSYNGNAGLAMAEGQYMMFLDDDDLLFPDHVEVLVNELESDADIAGSYALSWDVRTSTEAIGSEGRHYREQEHVTPEVFRQEFIREVIQHHNFIPIQAILFRRDLYDRYGGFDEDLHQLEDWNLWVRYSAEDDFKHVVKTTSLFRTPYDQAEREKRSALLHEAYGEVVTRNEQFIASVAVANT